MQGFFGGFLGKQSHAATNYTSHSLYASGLDIWPSECCGSSEESEDSERDSGEDTYLDDYSNDYETTSFRMLL